MDNKNDGSWYVGIAFLVGIVAFIGIWLYALSEWGLLIGLMIGWLPAIIGAFIIGLLWPIIVLIVGWLILKSL